jgi:predicted methyltransferase
MKLRAAVFAPFVLCAFVAGCASAPAQSEPAAAPRAEEAPAPAAPTDDEAPAAASPVISPAITEAVNAADRSPEDKALDAGRHPAELLQFFDVRPGMRVAELAAGGGYTTELLARVVGPTGVVYGQNNAFILERFAQKPWTERLQKPVMANVKRLDTELNAPFPSDVKNLDLVINVLFYHDTVWQKVDRAAMNRAIFEALTPGGVYGIVDHSAKAGAGANETETLHRIEQSVVEKEIEAAGFVLVQSADFLKNPNDVRDWNPSPRAAGERRGQSDRFVLKFVKPNKSQR